MERFLKCDKEIGYMRKELSVLSKSRLQIDKETMDHIISRNYENLRDKRLRIVGNFNDGYSLYHGEIEFSKIPRSRSGSKNIRKLLRLDNIVYLAPGIEYRGDFLFTGFDPKTIFMYSITDAAMLLGSGRADPEWFQFFREGILDESRRIKLNDLEVEVAVSDRRTIVRYDTDIPYITLSKT